MIQGWNIIALASHLSVPKGVFQMGTPGKDQFFHCPEQLLYSSAVDWEFEIRPSEETTRLVPCH